jgi:histone H3/H4
MSSTAENQGFPFLVGSRVRAYVSQHDLKLSEEALETLNRRVQELIDQAIERTKANKRLTVRPHDL